MWDNIEDGKANEFQQHVSLVTMFNTPYDYGRYVNFPVLTVKL
jgi:hypothetical protein